MRLFTLASLGLLLVVASSCTKGTDNRTPERTQVATGETGKTQTQAAGGLSAVVTDKTLADGFAAAKQDGKRVVAIFSAPSWCGWCKKLDKETLTAPQVQEELKRFHVVFVDYDKEKALDSKYAIEGVPTTIIFDKSGRQLGEIGGFRDAARFLEEIRKVSAP